MTDGLPEMENDSREMYSSARLVADCMALAGLAAEPFSSALVERVKSHAGDASQYDDLTALVLRWRPPSA